MPNDPAASERVTRAMRSSVPMTSLWRANYTIGSTPGVSAWTAIGETIQVPAGAVAVSYEYGGEPIDGGPWKILGAGNQT